MPTYDPSPDAVLLKQFRAGATNYYEESYISGSSVLIHTDTSGDITGSNFTLAANTGASYQYVVYQNNAFKVTSSGGNGVVSRTVSFSPTNSNVIITGIGTQSDLDNATVSFTGGNTLTISSIGSLKLLQLTQFIGANINSTTSYTCTYPEPTGQTSIQQMQFPFCTHYSATYANGGISAWTISNSSGTVSAVKTSLTANAQITVKICF